MDFDLFDSRGTPLGEQRFTWRDPVQQRYSKLDDDAVTRVRVIFMNGIESDAVRVQEGAKVTIPAAEVEHLRDAELCHFALLTHVLETLAERAGQDQRVTRFREALDEETEHLVKMRGWLANEVLGEAT